MKATINATELKAALRAAKYCWDHETQLPILHTFRIEAQSDGLELQATCLQNHFKARLLNVAVESPGVAQLPVKTLLDLAKKAKHGQSLTIETTGESATLSLNGSRIVASNLLSPDDFPEPPEMKANKKGGQEVVEVMFLNGVLSRAIDHCLAAIPVRDPRKILLGACFDFTDPEKPVVVSTDGKIMAKYEIATEDVEIGKSKNPLRVTIPTQALRCLLNFPESKFLSMKILVQHYSPSKRYLAAPDDYLRAEFRAWDSVLLTSPTCGTYPNWNMVIPSGFEYFMKLESAPALEVLSGARPYVDDFNRAVVLSPKWKAVTVDSGCWEKGTYRGEIALAESLGDPAPKQIAFNVGYLTDAISAFDKKAMVTIGVNNPKSPVIFTCEAEPEKLILVMPVGLRPVEEECSEPETESEESEVAAVAN